SRRRHTRWPRDWSSDVCSSDLPHCRTFCPAGKGPFRSGRCLQKEGRGLYNLPVPPDGCARHEVLPEVVSCDGSCSAGVWSSAWQIGRASCRERVEGVVWAGVLV